MKPNRFQEQPGTNPDTEADLAAWLFSGDTGIGLIDDAILIKRVFSRNQREFTRLETLPAIASSPQNRKAP
jgi:hypothetical protein